MPLYWKFSEKSKFSALRGRELLFFTAKIATTINNQDIEKYEFQAVDIAADKVVWRMPVDFSKPNYRNDLFVSPVIDKDLKRIYFRDLGSIHSVKLDGSDHHKIDFDPRAEHNANKKIKKEHLLGIHACNTALAIVKTKRGKELIFGCSTPSIYGHSSYGEYRGLRGVMYHFELGIDGKLKNKAPQTFFPSKITKNNRSGYNTGIWNIGIAPTILDDGSYLFATGNGPMIPNEGNFGCSVLRVDANTKKLAKSRNGYFSFFTAEPAPDQACFTMNMDLSSSAPATIKIKEGYLSAITGKDGYLRVFDPMAMPGRGRRGRNEYFIGGLNYGQPLIRKRSDGSIQVIAYGNNEDNSGRHEQSAFLSDDRELPRKDTEKFEKWFCVGLALRESVPGAKGLYLHSTGRFTGKRLIAEKDSDLAKIASSYSRPEFISKAAFDHVSEWPPYVRGRKLGYSIPKGFTPPKGFKRVPITLVQIGDTEEIGSIPDSKFWFMQNFVSTSKFSYPTFQDRKAYGGALLTYDPKDLLESDRVRKVDSLNLCGEIKDNDPKFVKIYQYLRLGWRSDIKSSWSIHSFTVTKDSIQKDWQYDAKRVSRLPNSSAAASKGKGENDGLVFLPAMLNREKDPKTNTFKPLMSRLYVFQLADGKLIDKIDFSGEPHFSMPLIVGNQVFIATKENGLRRFIVETGE